MRTSAFPSRKVYYKKGGLKQADKDFQSLNPTNVQITDVSIFIHSFLSILYNAL